MIGMVRNIWVTSDTHFNHENILTFTDKDGKSVRDFSSVQEMNQTLIDNWNSVVKPGDIVYHLGDVLFGLNKEDWLAKNMNRLMGSKRLIFGNHDDPKYFVGGGYFKKTMMWRKFPRNLPVLLTHVPVHPSTLEEGRFKGQGILNVHGHIHQNDSPGDQYVNVSVEKTNYTPVNLEELLSK